MSRSTNVLIGLTIVLIFVMGAMVGIIITGDRVDDQEEQISHLCVELDIAGSDSTDPVVLGACQP